MLWVMLWSALFLRDIERINSRTVVGGCCVVAGVIAISV
jgi:drug/metabolite transporter (DMT)-like permease